MNRKIVKVRTNKSLDKFKGEIVFKDKIEKARKTLEKYGVPRNLKETKKIKVKAA